MNNSVRCVSGRECLLLDKGWRFYRGDIPFPIIKGHSDTYHNAKAGRAWGAASPDFDDTLWREIEVPHDWVVEGPFDPEANLSQGFRPRGIGWYRRHFALPVSDRGRHLELQFDGVATHCTVWFNGSVVHRNWCGYTSFSIDITPFAQYGDELNTIVVRVDANAMEGWWYEGAGLYRHTWLMKRNAVHIATDGVYANPVRETDGAWTIPVEVTIVNSGEGNATVSVVTTLSDAAGKKLSTRRAKVAVCSLGQTVAKLTFSIETPRLWSVDEPVLYQVRTALIRDGECLDETATPCGFRTLRFDADQGFFLNDQPLKLKGVCNHQDHAGVGVAIPDSLWEFRLRKLKEMGVNAYRCAHNPPSVELLDCCDRLGILVMDENRHFNCSPEYMQQLEWLVRRDRNHPSIILWSVFNEEPMQGTESGYEMVRRMVAAVKRLDSTRPVAAAMNGGVFNPVNVSQAVDVVGFNYQIDAYDRFHEINPHVPLVSSEDTSAFMTRGEYESDPARNVLDSYDTQHAPWGATHRDAWKAVAERPYLAGGFVWTGFDYRGEPTPMSWPSTSSFFGCMDLCGFPKTAFYIHQAQWVEDKPVLHLVPHWNWPGREGRPVKVMALSNAETVELSLNGVSHGERRVDPYEMVSWDIPYERGCLEAVGRKNGRVVSRFAVATTGLPVGLQLVPDRSSLAGDGMDTQPVTVQAVDALGRVVPTANGMVEFELEGPGIILGVGNGDPNCHEPEKANRRSLFNGLAQVIVQSGVGSGTLILRAKSTGMKAVELSIAVDVVPSSLIVPPVQPVRVLRGWRMSPVTAIAPDPTMAVQENDMNTWVTIQPGELQPFIGGRWAIYRVRVPPSDAIKKAGGCILFKGITGRAQVWLDGQSIGLKNDAECASLTVPVEAYGRTRTLNVLVERDEGLPGGLSGRVEVADGVVLDRT